MNNFKIKFKKKNILKKIITYLIIIILVFFSGFATAWKIIYNKQEIKEIEIVKTVDKIVYRDVEKLTFVKCKQVLNRYDTDPMLIDYKINKLNKKYTDMDINWKLYERAGKQNIKVPVYKTSNWRFYAGISAGVVVTAGIGSFLFKIMR